MEKEKQITIGIIEDHTGLRVSLQNFLQYNNFKVVLEVANGQLAIESLQLQEVLWMGSRQPENWQKNILASGYWYSAVLTIREV